MAKPKIVFCPKCRCYTEHLYMGKRKMTSSEKRDKIEATICTFGVVPILDFICGEDTRPKFWKCTECDYIHENE